MTTPEKIGRFCWLSYLILSFPISVFGGWAGYLLIRDYFVPDTGVVESAPVSPLQVATMTTCLVILPVLWLLGVMIADRFNGRWKAMIPFASHLLPISILAAQFSRIERSEGDADERWIFIYLLATGLLLVVGVISVITANLKSTQPMGQRPI